MLKRESRLSKRSGVSHLGSKAAKSDNGPPYDALNPHPDHHDHEDENIIEHIFHDYADA